MAALLYLITAILLGAGLWRLTRLRSYPFEAAAAALVIGLVAWSWFAFLVSLIMPYRFSLPLTAAVSCITGLYLLMRQPAQALPHSLLTKPQWLAWAGVSIGLTGLISWLHWTHDLITTSSGIYSAGATWADFGLHSSLITHLAALPRLSLDLPVSAGTHLTYPFLIDFLSSIYLRGGWSLHLAIALPAILTSAAIIQLFIGLSLRLFHRLSSALLAPVLFLFGGAFAATDAAWADWRTSGVSLTDFLSHLPHDYTSFDQANLHFNNVVADAILPQRAFLFGLALFLIILSLLWINQQHSILRLRLTTAVLIGLLPLTHAHTFIVSSLIWAGFAVTDLYKHPQNWRYWIIPALIIGTLSLPQLAWQQLANGYGTGGHIALGWMAESGQSIWVFWWNNFGFFLPYALVLPFLLIRSKNKLYLVLYLPLLIVLILSQLYAFQPFEYDNLKLIMYGYLGLCLFASWHFTVVIKRYPKALLAVIPILVITLIPGTLSITRETQLQDQFAAPDDVLLADWTSHNTSPDTVFITTDRPNQPVATLAGRSIVLGYRGWLYSYHLPYEDRLKAVTLALADQTNAPEVQRYHARYLVVGAYEDPEWQIDRSSLNHNHPIAYQNPSWTVYTLNNR